MIASAVRSTFAILAALLVSACTVNGTPVTPKTPTWTTFGELSQPRAYATAVGLASGEILVVGGLDRADSNVTNADRHSSDRQHSRRTGHLRGGHLRIFHTLSGLS